MRKRIIRIVAWCMAVLFLAGVVAPVLITKVYGVPTDEKMQEYEDKEKSAWQQVMDYENELSQLSEDAILLENQKAECEEELEKLQAELKEAEALEEEQRDNYRERFATLCDQGVGSYLEIIFSATSISDLIEKIVIVREIAEYDKTMLEKIASVKNKILEDRQRTEELLVQIEQSGKEIKNTESEIEDKLEEASAYHRQLEQDKEAYAEYLAEKDAAEQRTRDQAGIGNQVGSADPARASSASLSWPTDTTYVTSHFSPSRVNPVTGVLRPHTGTDIGASQGAPVWASKSGTVILAEYNGGYGNCIIIDHGDGIKTLYGHLSAILVSSGQNVSQGAQIGRVGSTGNSTGPHLHYEVLVDGVAVDPMQFF